MTNPHRTPTPDIDRIWDRATTVGRWLGLWVQHLLRQMEINPDHPGHRDPKVLDRYAGVAASYQTTPHIREQILDEIDREERTTRHDVVAALAVFNRWAGATVAHHGLTSHDIVETARQQAINESLAWVVDNAVDIIDRLADYIEQHQWIQTVGRTHGQPAQVIPYTLRWATVLDPLVGWYRRAHPWQRHDLHGRPPAGAVGTHADLARVLGRREGTHEQMFAYLTDSTTSLNNMTVTRQVYHRSWDLHTAGLLLQLGTIADTWATDRRLETMLGHGYERRDGGQVGSSAMPHKCNPVLSERIHALTTVLAGHHQTAVSQAMAAEWLEGDVSGSASRRAWMPGIFQTTAQILLNWVDAIERWEIDPDAMSLDLERHEVETHTGAALGWLVDHGIPRQIAHDLVAELAATKPPYADARWLAKALADVVSSRPDLVTARPVSPGAWQDWRLELGFCYDRIMDVVREARELSAHHRP